jgi:DNA-binding MarR family transcriptional regulator
MQRLADVAASVDDLAEALVSLLDPARFSDLIRVSPTQLRVLTLLRANPAMNVNALAQALRVNPSSASRLCDRLEATGLLRRQADPRDRREVNLRTTQAADELLAEWSRHRREALLPVLAKMPATARQELVRSLRAFGGAADELLSGQLYPQGQAASRTA